MIASGVTQFDVIVGELALLDGQRRSDVAHMALLTPPRRASGDRRPETVLIFLDLGGGGASGLARAMLDNFSRTYWRSSGTVTTALRKAAGAANAHLREENRLMPVSHRRRAGLVCAVLRGDVVYFAQIGPAKALLVKGDRVTQFPLHYKDRLPLGVSGGLDIRFSHSQLQPGDRLLLTGESWTVEMQEAALTDAIRTGGIEDAMLTLENQAGRSPFSALVVECASLPESADAARPAQQEALTPAIAPEPHVEMDRSPVVSSQVRSELTYAEATTDVAQVDDRWRPSETPIGFSFDRTRLDQSRQGLRRAGTAFTDGVRALLARVLPEPEEAPLRRMRQARGVTSENTTMMAGIAVAIPLLVAFVVVTFYLQRSADERREALVNRALDAVETAREAGDSDDAHGRWEAALRAAQDALLVVPGDEDMFAMHTEARANLDALDGILRPDLVSLWDYGGGQGRQLTASQMQVYVLHTDQDLVTQHTLNQSRQSITDDQLNRIAYRGQRVGDEDIGELRDIVWLSAGGGRAGDRLLIMTDDDKLLQHSVSWGLSWITFEFGLSSGNVRALRSYDGKLYAIDPVQNQVWRFPSNAEGFGPPEKYFPIPPLDLSNAVDMAIDGAVYIMLSDGQVYKFFGGEMQPFQFRGLPQQLIRPVALVSEGDATSGALYVADAGAQSIVALTKSGEFIFQIKADKDALADLEDLAIEAVSRTLFILASGQLYSLDLPQVPELSNLE